MGWHAVTEKLWVSLFWDVYREGGGWRASPAYAGHPLPLLFDSAEAAMAYVEDDLA